MDDFSYFQDTRWEEMTVYSRFSRFGLMVKLELKNCSDDMIAMASEIKAMMTPN